MTNIRTTSCVMNAIWHTSLWEGISRYMYAFFRSVPELINVRSILWWIYSMPSLKSWSVLSNRIDDLTQTSGHNTLLQRGEMLRIGLFTYEHIQHKQAWPGDTYVRQKTGSIVISGNVMACRHQCDSVDDVDWTRRSRSRWNLNQNTTFIWDSFTKMHLKSRMQTVPILFMIRYQWVTNGLAPIVQQAITITKTVVNKCFLEVSSQKNEREGIHWFIYTLRRSVDWIF